MTGTMNDLLYVTLARAGSKGVPDKHTRLLGNKTVIEWTIEAVKNCIHKGDYAVSSDDYLVLSIARHHKATGIVRPAYLARDDTPTLPALTHAVKTMEQTKGRRYKYVIEVRATSPFKTSDDIDACIDLLIRSDADSVIGVAPLEDHHPMRIKWLDEDGRIRDFIPEPESGRRQDCQPKAYIRNGTIYALRTPIEKLFGHENSIGYVMPPERSVNIDTELDWKLCQLMTSRT